MFTVKVVDKATKKDVVILREYEDANEASRYYNLIRDIAITSKDKIIRAYDEKLEQPELKYSDIVLYLLEGDKTIRKFMIG